MRVGLAPDTSLAVKVTVVPASPVRLVSASLGGRRVSGVLAGDLETVEVRASGPQSASATASVTGGSFELELPKVPRAELAQAWQLQAVDPAGNREPILWPDDTRDQWLGRGSGPLVLGRGFSGSVEVVEATGVLLLEDLRLAPGHLDVTARWLGRGPAGFELSMAGARATLVAEPTAWNGSDDELRLRIPLTWDEWGLGTAPVPLDRYAFRLTHGGTSAEGRSSSAPGCSPTPCASSSTTTS